MVTNRVRDILQRIGVAIPAGVPYAGSIYAQLLSQLSSEEQLKLLTEIRELTGIEYEALSKELQATREQIIRAVKSLEETLLHSVQQPSDRRRAAFPFPTSLHNQTPPEPNFVGRTHMLKTLTQWWHNPEVQVGALIGWGGTGKSALARKWFDSREENDIKSDGIFWWGFYRNPYLDRFLDSLLNYLSQGRTDISQLKGTYAKVEKIEEFVLEGAHLIVLDGLEEMQKGETANEFGCMAHWELSELLKYFADAKDKGLCLITTRYPLTDIKNYEGSSYQTLEVERLSQEDARALFAKTSVRGTQEEIDAVTEEYKGHALSLTLLANYLAQDFGGDIKKAQEIPKFYLDSEAGGKAHRILLWYEKQLTEEQCSFMKIFSLFRREITEEDFEHVFRTKMDTNMNSALVDMRPFSFHRLVDNLQDRRLISKSSGNTYTTHPLIKNYFEFIFDTEDRKLCHRRIYQYMDEHAKEHPETLEEMQPLFEQIYHGCQANMYQEAFDLYWQNVQRKEEYFLIYKLGAWDTCLNITKNFFEQGNLQADPLIPNARTKAELISTAGLSIKMLGRLKEPEALYNRAIELNISQKDWRNASIDYLNITLLQMLTGQLKERKETTRKVIRLTRKANEIEYECYSTAYFAHTLFLLGETKKAIFWFEEANKLQRRYDPLVKYLYSIRGVLYADFIFALGKIEQALEVTQGNLKISKRRNLVNDINLCYRSLASIFRHLQELEEAEKYATNAISGAKRTGRPDIEVEALLALAMIRLDHGLPGDTEESLNIASKICKRCGFSLYEPEVEIIQGKSCLSRGDFEQAAAFVTLAYQKATGMHSRWPEGDAAHSLGEIYWAMGEKDKAREWLEKAIACRKDILDPRVNESKTILKSL